MYALIDDKMRSAPPEIEARFAVARQLSSDINEHLGLLRELANDCEHVTEFGMRWASGSTLAFLAAQPKKLVSWDIDPDFVTGEPVLRLLLALKSSDNRCTFEPRVGNTLEALIEPTDLLFIDTLHTFKQLQAELERHCDPKDSKVRKYLAFHDTTTFGTAGEDGSEPGLRMAIRWFQREFAFPLWKLIHDRENNNGLVVLARV